MANILSNTDGGMLTKDNCAVVFIDHQPQMSFGESNTPILLIAISLILRDSLAKIIAYYPAKRGIRVQIGCKVKQKFALTPMCKSLILCA